MPKDGIQRVDLDELVLRAAGFEPDREHDRDRQHDERDSSASHLATRALRPAGQQDHDRRTEHRDRPTGRSATECGHHSLTARIAATTRAAPAEHRQGVRAGETGLQLAQPFEVRPTSAASPCDDPVDRVVVDLDETLGEELRRAA